MPSRSTPLHDAVRDPIDHPRRLAPPRTIRTVLPGGGFVLRSPEPLGPHARCIGEWIEHWAVATPDAVALAEREATGEWRRLRYAELRRQIGGIAQALLDMDLPAGAPVVVVSDNSIDHALLMLAALHVGRPVCTVSSAYSRNPRDYGNIQGILRKLQPALIHVASPALYRPVIWANEPDARRVYSVADLSDPAAATIEAMARTPETAAVMHAFHAIGADDHAKYLLTSGSTGRPKVVINTHRMLCANQQMIAQAWRFLETEKPVVLDWLPWSHTFGGNHNLNLVLRNGGTLYIDDGRPAPGLVDKTVRNLREVQPTLYFNVPRGFDMLLPYLEGDAALAARFFARLSMVFYAGAALPQSTWERLQTVARGVRDDPVWFTTSWGSTETSPAITAAHWPLDRAGVIGLPLPDLELKFVPSAGKLEMRVRGVSVFPGYRGEPELTAQAFDEEGYYRIGDAGRLLDEARPEAGVVFDGRVAEDFKLGSGTWVSVGTLRVKLLSALAPWAQDAVITGHDGAEVGALVFPSAMARELGPDALRARAAQALAQLQAQGGGSSQCPARLMFLADAPDAEAGEITDKGYVNQRAVLQRRADEVRALHANPPDPRVVLATWAASVGLQGSQA